MATPYEKIYNRFSLKITDFNLTEIDDYSLGEMLLGWLNSSIVNVRKREHDLSLRDDEIQEFNEDLSDLEIELLALGMKLAWVDQYLNSTENVLQFIGGKEEKYYSQANHIAELRELRKDTVREMQSLHNYDTYANNSYFDD
jgi:hypothetical protein